jgi:hypothetical protein
MLQNLIIFPLTDFPFVRPEFYPSLLPTGIYDESKVMALKNLTYYLSFIVPFCLFLLGLVATGAAMLRRRAVEGALGVTFVVGFLLHYWAAHTQINTHIVTMSVYAAALGAILYDVIEPRLALKQRALFYSLVSALVIGWFLSLMAQPLYIGWRNWRTSTATLQLTQVSGFKVTPEEAQALSGLSDYVDASLPPDHELYVGLHRHDVLIVGDILIYHVLNRPSLTRYEELHPAITDTQPVQREIIANLEEDGAPLIVLKHVFPDDLLDEARTEFRENVPHIGATDLDEYIQENYFKVQTFGPYDVWQRNPD